MTICLKLSVNQSNNPYILVIRRYRTLRIKHYWQVLYLGLLPYIFVEPKLSQGDEAVMPGNLKRWEYNGVIPYVFKEGNYFIYFFLPRKIKE